MQRGVWLHETTLCLCVCVRVCGVCVWGGGQGWIIATILTKYRKLHRQVQSSKPRELQKKRKAVVKINSTTELRTDVYIPTNSGVPTKTFGLEFLLRSRAAPKSMIFSCSPLGLFITMFSGWGGGGGEKEGCAVSTGWLLLSTYGRTTSRRNLQLY